MLPMTSPPRFHPSHRRSRRRVARRPNRRHLTDRDPGGVTSRCRAARLAALRPRGAPPDEPSAPPLAVILADDGDSRRGRDEEAVEVDSHALGLGQASAGAARSRAAAIAAMTAGVCGSLTATARSPRESSMIAEGIDWARSASTSKVSTASSRAARRARPLRRA